MGAKLNSLKKKQEFKKIFKDRRSQELLSIQVPEFKKVRIAPGIDLITEEHPWALSSAVGLYFGVGSRNENKKVAGATHLIEHFLFKGSTRLGAEDISRQIEMQGGDLNAYTDREITSFHAWMPKDKWDSALALMLEMIFDARLDPDEFYKERDVVYQELRGYEDSAEDEFWEAYLETPFGNHPVGRRVGAFARDIPSLSYERVIEYLNEVVFGSPLAIVVVGPIKHDEVFDQVKKLLHKSKEFLWGDRLIGKFKKRRKYKSDPLQLVVPTCADPASNRSRFVRFDSDQVHIGFAFPAVGMRDPSEVLYSSLASLLGVGSSSKLFKEIRENHGLAYSAGAYLTSFTDSGLLTGYITTDKKRLYDALKLSGEVCRRVAQGVSLDDLGFLRNMLEGTLFMNYEGVMNRMENLGRGQILLNKCFGIEMALRDLNKVSIKNLNRVAVPLATDPCLFVLGPLSKSEFSKCKRAWNSD